MSQVIERSSFGSMVHTSAYEDITEIKIDLPYNHYTRDYSQQAEHLKRHTESIKAFKEHMASGENGEPFYTCGDREPDGTPTSLGEFLPVFAG